MKNPILTSVCWLLLIVLLLGGCLEKVQKKERIIPPIPAIVHQDSLDIQPLTKAQLYDKILGMLVGSAIGDAMGAPTEMWSRAAIRRDFDFVQGVDTMVRAPSAEGIWDYNLPAGATTDDTRWKWLFGKYMLQEADLPQLSPKNFAQFIMQAYEQEIAALKATESFDPEPFEQNARRMVWLQEWALVAKPFVENDLQGYAAALNRFYGGDLACAGMLYAPMVGLGFTGNPSAAYESAYALNVFDLGFARDLSSLTAAMAAVAMQAEPSQARVYDVVRDVDPQHFYKSRLIGRKAYQLLTTARQMVSEARELKDPEAKLLPALKESAFTKADSLKAKQWQYLYEQLDLRNQDAPFHAGEIFLVGVTAMLITEMDFEESMQFIVNFGRDNDTTAAVFGAIIGAYHGYEQLPKPMAETVIHINQSRLGLDLVQLAEELTVKLAQQ